MKLKNAPFIAVLVLNYSISAQAIECRVMLGKVGDYVARVLQIGKREEPVAQERRSTNGAQATARQKPVSPLDALAQSMGFETNLFVAEKINREIEDYLGKAPIATLVDGLHSRNGLSGRIQHYNEKAIGIMRDETKNEKQKRQELGDFYRRSVLGGSTDILQIIRYRNNLEKELGWGNLWSGLYQYRLNGSTDAGKFVEYTSSFEGLLFAPGPDKDSILVMGNTYGIDPRQMISSANNGIPVDLAQLNIHREESRAQNGRTYSLQFSAVIRPAKEGATEVLAIPPKKIMGSGQFLVQPFQVAREQFALEKTQDGSYIFHTIYGYGSWTRIELNQIPNRHDLRAVVDTALRDSGLDSRNSRVREENGGTKISLDPSVSSEVRALFEEQLAGRITELKDHIQARRSRTSSSAAGVNPQAAIQASKSGYEKVEDVVKGLAIDYLDGRSSIATREAWHADYPTLNSPRAGEYIVRVDDRIYGDVGHMKGTSGLQAAKAKRMTPVRMEGGAYIVYYRADPAFLWSGYFESYAVFSTVERAQEFIRTHRFVIGQERGF